MRLALISLLMIPLAVGCGGDGEKRDTGEEAHTDADADADADFDTDVNSDDPGCLSHTPVADRSNAPPLSADKSTMGVQNTTLPSLVTRSEPAKKTSAFRTIFAAARGPVTQHFFKMKPENICGSAKSSHTILTVQRKWSHDRFDFRVVCGRIGRGRVRS
jgi:hypothetical protein